MAEKYTGPQLLVLKFADSPIPSFSESKNKDYVSYGGDNAYPEYLTYLYDKSAKHNAILNGKAKYIFGDGFENGDFKINRLGESLNDISQKAILDLGIYGGYRFEVIWNKAGRIGEVYHVDFNTIRTGKDSGFYYKETWPKKSYSQEDLDEAFIPGFNPNDPTGSQIYAFNEYRPGVRFYPLPDYIGCLNYIETDIEISKFHLSAIKNGMMPSKMIQFYNGEPDQEHKAEIERQFSKKFAGSENAGRFLLVFNQSKDHQMDVSDLSASELDKQFDLLNTTCQQEIFAGHSITSPMLFGIKTEGQLGGNTELYTSYSIFQNTYSKPKAATFSKEIEYLLEYSLFPGNYDLQPTDPIGLQFDVKDVINSLPKKFVFTKLGIPEDQWNLENIGSDNKPTPTVPLTPSTKVDDPTHPKNGVMPETMANENLKNLTAKQHQQVQRIIRQHSKGQLSTPAAKVLLRGGLGLTDADINDILGIPNTTSISMSATVNEQDIIQMFDACGDNRTDFEILKFKAVAFSSELEAEADEEIYLQEAFKTYDVTATEAQIIDLIKKDKLITPQVIADVIGQTEAYVVSKIDSLTQRGYITQNVIADGEDDLIERTIPEDTAPAIPPTTIDKKPITQISIKYSYEVKPGVGAPVIKTTRPFCRKMLELNRLYSRAEIENISQRLGYSVFDRKGGFWGHSPECRHRWVSNIVVKKSGS